MCKDLEENVQKICIFAVIQYVKDLSKVWHRYEVKIQKDTKRYDLRTYAVLWYFKRTYTQQKSGTALLPFHSSRLWYCLCIKTATPKPTPYVYILIGTRLCAYVYIHTIGILVSHCFGYSNLPDSDESKQSALRRY